MESKKQYEWIDFLKTLAMIAVILNHTYGVIFNNYNLLLHTIFSVTMFVFLGGITASISIEKQRELKPSYLLNKITGILIPYSFLVLIYGLYIYGGEFSSITFFTNLTHFSFPAMYYIAFFIQLILISTLLYKIIKSNFKSPKIILVFVAIYLLSKYFTNHTVVSDIGLAGGKLFGGTYLFVFSLGILFYMWLPILSNKKISLLILVLSISGLIFFENKKYILNSWFNPPTKLTIMYTLLVFGIVFSLFNIFPKVISTFRKPLSIFNYIGKNSLYVFLYHSLFITIAIRLNILEFIGIDNKIFYAIWVLFCSIIPPLIISYIFNKYINPNINKMFFYINKFEKI